MKPRTPVYVNILVIISLLIMVFYMFVQNSSFFSSPYFWGLLVISAIMAMIHGAIGDLIENAKFQKLTEEEKAAYLKEKQIPYFKKLWDSAFKKQANTEEQDILIDHGFDGIMELDNQLPKWWLGLFYIGTAYCIIYIIAYSFTDFAHPVTEYDNEYKAQIAAVDEYMKTVPQATLETVQYKEDQVEDGKIIFETNCVSCHMQGGRGGIGPNLTDNYWINQPEKKLIKNIFWMVENGSPNNPTMVAFGKNGQLTGNDIQKVASYIYYINQVQAPITPAQGGAAPQGTPANWEK